MATSTDLWKLRSASRLKEAILHQSSLHNGWKCDSDKKNYEEFILIADMVGPRN